MNFIKGASALKVKEVPGYVQKYAGENLTPAKVESRFSQWLSNYKKKVRVSQTFVDSDFVLKESLIREHSFHYFPRHRLISPQTFCSTLTLEVASLWLIL